MALKLTFYKSNILDDFHGLKPYFLILEAH